MDKIKWTEHKIREILANKHCNDFFITNVKTGSSWFDTSIGIIDAWAMKKSWAHPLITGYEIKINRNDFIQDNKWTKYLEYCNAFYFVCPDKTIIKESEVPENVGLMYVRPKSIKTVIKAKYRDIEIPDTIFRYILMNKIDSDRIPFYNSKVEYFKEWIDNKRTTQSLGYDVSSKLIQKLSLVEEKIKTYKRYKDSYKEIKEVCKEFGIDGYDIRWTIENKLKELQNNKIDKNMLDKLTELREKLNNIIGE